MSNSEIIGLFKQLVMETSDITPSDERKYQIARRLRMHLPKEGPTLLEAVNCWNAYRQSEAHDA